jgi:hypothetical protein
LATAPYPSVERRQQVLDAFYGSEEWMENYEETVMPLIESYHTVVVPAAPSAIEALSAGLGSGAHRPS